MNSYEKAKILKDRHIEVIIEWGGTDLFTQASNISLEGVVEFLEIMKLDSKKEINKLLTDLIGKEYEKN